MKQPTKGRQAADYLTVTNRGLILIGQEVYEQAGRPAYLRPEWAGGQISLWVSAAPEKRRQGIAKVIVNQTSYAISVKPFIAEAGISEGRYQPTILNHERIAFPMTPFWTPGMQEAWDPDVVLPPRNEPTLYTVEQAAEVLAVSAQKLARDIQDGVINPQNLNPGGERQLYVLTDRDLYLYRRWRWETQRIGSDPDAHE